MSWRVALVLVVGVGVLAGSFLYLRPAPSPAPAVPAVRVVELAVADGQRLAGPAVIPALQGEVLVLRVTSDRADELHLHGYDLSTKLTPGVPAELRVTASASGRFELELHGAHTEIAAVEVQPR